MTSTTDTAGHPDVAEISDLTEGLLPPDRTADVQRHLDECDLCADVHASLEEIRGLLGTLPGGQRMPDDVAGRIDAALAAEALLQATAPDTGGDPAPVGASTPDHRAHVSRETSVSAARPAGHARSATTGPGRKERQRGVSRRATVLGAVFAVAALGLGSVLVAYLNDGKPSDDTSTASDTFSEAKLENQVADLLAENQSTGNGSRAPHSLGGGSAPNSEGPRIFREPAVPPCIQQGIGTNDTAIATQDGTFQGTDAMLVVLPDPADTTRVVAYIMDATCVAHPSSGTAKVLLKDAYTRS
ncbi:hypothetical protein QQY66_24180 [Streptomyces sp. DG2A-72]|uniref:hypothetical protein n=1 Tax=Streptomyces sp. DG2A-72 TaxID=3051386 RepID=UPI00265C1443|nr:hypothetical protein [Streptomyces sp. DG2A-72]MDO0934626.1 hypothetical protein [Streptomyces sp. DG2A-72]